MFNRSKKETRDALVALGREIEQLRADIQQQNDLVARERQSALEFAERLTMIEGKVSGMGAELSRQLHELGNDIESLSQRPEDALTAALGDASQGPPDFATAAATLGVTEAELIAALGIPEGGMPPGGQPPTNTP